MLHFYHGTTTEGWEAAQRQRVLIATPPTGKPRAYLTTDPDLARRYGPVLLRVTLPSCHPFIKTGDETYKTHMGIPVGCIDVVTTNERTS